LWKVFCWLTQRNHVSVLESDWDRYPTSNATHSQNKHHHWSHLWHTSWAWHCVVFAIVYKAIHKDLIKLGGFSVTTSHLCQSY
jgi:hypothetical protein